MAEAEGAKNVAEWARDEALRAKAKAEFARMEAESSKEKAEEEAYNLGVAETQATLKAQVPRVCRLYCSQVWNEALRQAWVEASSNLWKVENVYYLPGATKTHENLNPEAPQKTTESTVDAQAPHAEEPALSVQPLQTGPPSEGSKGPEVVSTQLSKEGVKIKLKK